MAWAVTGLDAVAHVERIDRDATLLYWCHEAEAAALCRERGVRYVFWASRYYRASHEQDGEGRTLVTRVTAAPELFFGESGWNERNQVMKGDPNMVYTLISLLGQPRERLAALLPSFELIAEAADRNQPSRPAARVFELGESRAGGAGGYPLPRPGVASPAMEAIRLSISPTGDQERQGRVDDVDQEER
jgi:hypothetical protein